MKIQTSCLLVMGAIFSASSFAATSPKCPGESGYYFTNYKQRNPQQGGFVSYSADVIDDEEVYIAPTAAVCNSSSVSEDARIYGNAIIRGNAEISGDAKVYGNAVIEGDAVITDNARVYENARVGGSSFISGKARIKGWSKIYDQDVSSGVKDAPQFTQAQLRQMERDRQAQLAGQQAAQAKLQKNWNLWGKASDLIRRSDVIQNNYTSSGEYLYLEKTNDPCILKFRSSNFKKWSRTFNLHYRKYIETGVETGDDINKYFSKSFARDFLRKSGDTIYYKNNLGYKKNLTAVPAMIISNSKVKAWHYYEELGEHNGLAPTDSEKEHLDLLFSSKNDRDNFANALKSLYNSCPSA